MTGLFTPQPPARPIPPKPVAALFLPPQNPHAAPQWAGQSSGYTPLDLDDNNPLVGGACNLDGPCESCQ